MEQADEHIQPSSTHICIWSSAKSKKKCEKQASVDSSYCALHTPLQGERIHCCLCSQQILTSKWERHQNICSRIETFPSYYAKGCNMDFQIEFASSENPSNIDVCSLSKKIIDLYYAHVHNNIASEHLFDATPDTRKMFTEIQAGVDLAASTKWRKHRLQEASIAGHLTTKNLIVPNEMTTVVDFGSGQAAMSVSLSKLHYPLQYICIERQAYNNKCEKRIHQQRSFRAKIDLCDVNLTSLMSTAIAENRCLPCERALGIGKHLCGSATDLALNAMRRFDQQQQPQLQGNAEEVPRRANLIGLCIATCCHSSCSWDLLAAKEWLCEVGISSQDEFDALKKMAGFFSSNDSRKKMDNFIEIPVSDDDAANDADQVVHVDSSIVVTDTSIDAETESTALRERMQLGRAAKRLIDWGRVVYIRKHFGFTNVDLIHYVDESVTPENCLIVATL